MVYAEEGSDTIYLFPDGDRDEIYCGKANVDHDVVIYLGAIDPLDDFHDTNKSCEAVTVQR